MSPVSVPQGRLRPTEIIRLVQQFLAQPDVEFNHTDERITAIEADPEETIVYTQGSHGSFSYLVVFEESEPSYLESITPTCRICDEEAEDARLDYLRMQGWRG